MNKPIVIVLATRNALGTSTNVRALGQSSDYPVERRLIEWTLQSVSDAGLPFRIEEFEPGYVGSAIRKAVMTSKTSSGCLLLPFNRPFLKSSTLNKVARYIVEGNVVLPYFRGVRGYPIGFGNHSKNYFLSLKDLDDIDNLVPMLPLTEVTINDEGISYEVKCQSFGTQDEERLHLRNGTLTSPLLT